MRFFDLNASNLRDYISECQEFKGLWFFQHVPKTAGSSLSAEFAANLIPYRNVTITYKDTVDDNEIAMNEKFETFLNEICEVEIRSASGHYLSGDMDKLSTVAPQTRFVTFLREPFKRLVSEYIYSCSPIHPPYESFMKKYPTFLDFATDPVEKNKISFYLYGTDKITEEDALKRLNKRFHFVGLQDRYPVSFVLMSSLLWTTSLPKLNERIAPQNSKASDLMKFRGEVLKLNKLDYFIYEATTKLYERLAPSIWDIVKNK